MIKLHPETGLRVSSDGTIFGRRGRPIWGGVTRTGYRVIAVSTDGIVKYQSAHRLVAETFLGASNDRQVNHKDGDKLNNDISNLEWCTSSENNRHALNTGLRDMSVRRGHRASVGSKNGRARVSEDQVREIRGLKYSRGDRPWLRYGLSNAQFYAIRNWRSWSEVA